MSDDFGCLKRIKSEEERRSERRGGEERKREGRVTKRIDKDERELLVARLVLLRGPKRLGSCHFQFWPVLAHLCLPLYKSY